MPTPESITSLEIENIAALPAFYELMDFASQVCLRNPSRVQEIVARDYHLVADAPHVPNVWAHKVSLELASSVNRKAVEYQEADYPLLQIKYEEIMAKPELLGPRPMPEVQLLVKAFGEALLEEAFTCLGEDALAKVAQWQQEDALLNRYELLNWLLNRVIAIRDPKLGPVVQTVNDDVITSFEAIPGREILLTDMVGDINLEEIPSPVLNNTPYDLSPDTAISDEIITIDTLEEPDFYHPIRLSPKVLGVYPDTRVTPTCLGVSILTASFFHKAGEPMLHTGVMRTAVLDAKRYLSMAGEALEAFAQLRRIVLPDGIIQNIRFNSENYLKAKNLNRGFHAGLITKAYAERWVFLDPNYNINKVMNDPVFNVAEARQDLLTANGSLGGVEQTVEQIDGLIPESLFTILQDAAELIPRPGDLTELLDTLPLLDDPIAALRSYVKSCIEPLRSDKDLSEQSYLHKCIALHLFNTIEFDAKGKTQEELDAAIKESDKSIDANTRAYIDTAIDDVIEMYVFPHTKPKDLAASLRRLQTDVRYRERRLEDITLLPQMTVLRLISQLTNDILNEKTQYQHTYMDIGLPEHRIGMCVLSDFAAHSGDSLPPSFWTSHWASGIAWYEHSRINIRNKDQFRVARNIARVLESNWLTYASNHEKITSFLEQGAMYQPTRRYQDEG